MAILLVVEGVGGNEGEAEAEGEAELGVLYFSTDCIVTITCFLIGHMLT